MLTREYITWLLNTTGNQLTREELLIQVNIAQNMLFAQPTYFNRTKPDPFLTTEDGVFRYQLPNNVKVVTRVYALASNRKFFFPLYGGFSNMFGYKQPSPVNSYASPEVNIVIDTIQSIAPDRDGPVILFPRQYNPRTTDDLYQIEQYEWPVQLTSEDIQLSVPEEHQFGYLYYMVLKFLEEQGYGNSIYNKDREEAAQKAWSRDADIGFKSNYIRTLPKDV